MMIATDDDGAVVAGDGYDSAGTNWIDAIQDDYVHGKTVVVVVVVVVVIGAAAAAAAADDDPMHSPNSW
jgi:hypothetical protein